MRFRFSVQSCLRCLRSSWRRVKNLSHAARKRSHTAFSLPRVTGPIGLPFGLQRLHRVGGLAPSRSIGHRFGARAQRFLLLQVLDALGGLLREEVLALVVDLLLRGLEARPQRLGLRARRRGHRLPPLLQRAHLVRRPSPDRSRRAATSASILVQSSSCTWTLAQRFHSSASRSSWMRGVSDVAHRLQAHHQVFAILLGRQRPHRADRQLDVLHQLIGLLEREAFGGGAGLELLHQRLQPLQVLGLLLALGIAMHLLVRFELLRGGVVARAQLGIDLDVARDRLPLLAQRVPLAANVVVVRVRGERFDLGHQRRQPFAPTACASWRRSKRFSAARQASSKRRSSSAAHASGIAGMPSHVARACATPSVMSSPVRPSTRAHTAARSACSCSSARRWRSASARAASSAARRSRTTVDALSKSASMSGLNVGVGQQLDPRHARRRRRPRAAARSRRPPTAPSSARPDRAPAADRRPCRRGRSRPARPPARWPSAACAPSSAPPWCAPSRRSRSACRSTGSAMRSSAATAASACSPRSATPSISAASVRRSSATSRAPASAA